MAGTVSEISPCSASVPHVPFGILVVPLLVQLPAGGWDSSGGFPWSFGPWTHVEAPGYIHPEAPGFWCLISPTPALQKLGSEPAGGGFFSVSLFLSV